VRNNPSISGEALQAAMQKQRWDPSVKALAAVPQTLQMMSEKLDWTQQVGDAFLAQQANLLAAIQRLRQRADAAGHLKSTDEQKVTKAAAPAAGGKASVITIESASPDAISVPIYDPGVVFGAWPYPDYQPFYWHPPGYVAGNVFSFATGVAVGAAVWGGVDWARNRVTVDVNRFNRFNRTKIVNNAWAHSPRHRRNVPYREAWVAKRFGQADRLATREAFRSRAQAGRRELAKVRTSKVGSVARTKVSGARARVSARSHTARVTRTGRTVRKTTTHRSGRSVRRTTTHRTSAIRAGRTHAFRAGGVHRARDVHRGGRMRRR
jgi:hypothetical protein